MEQTADVKGCIAKDCLVDNKTSTPGISFEYCLEQNEKTGFVCTREKGHTGDHVACVSTQHNLASWPQITITARLGEPEPARQTKRRKKMSDNYLAKNIERIKTIKGMLDDIELDLDDQTENSVQSRIDDYLNYAEDYLDKINDLLKKGMRSAHY